MAVTVAVSPGFSVPGLTEQLTVGGSKAFTVKLAVASATSQGLRPSLPGLPCLTPHFTVYAPAASEPVATKAVAPVPVTPVPLKL